MMLPNNDAVDDVKHVNTEDILLRIMSARRPSSIPNLIHRRSSSKASSLDAAKPQFRFVKIIVSGCEFKTQEVKQRVISFLQKTCDHLIPATIFYLTRPGVPMISRKVRGTPLNPDPSNHSPSRKP